MKNNGHHDAPPPFWRTRFGAGCLVLAGVAAWFLWTEHRAHLLGAWPLLFFLACPLMHRFMHHGRHGSHGGHGEHQRTATRYGDNTAEPHGPARRAAGRPGETP